MDASLGISQYSGPLFPFQADQLSIYPIKNRRLPVLKSDLCCESADSLTLGASTLHCNHRCDCGLVLNSTLILENVTTKGNSVAYLPYQYTWSMLQVFSRVRVAYLLLLLRTCYFMFFIAYFYFPCLVLSRDNILLIYALILVPLITLSHILSNTFVFVKR